MVLSHRSKAAALAGVAALVTLVACTGKRPSAVPAGGRSTTTSSPTTTGSSVATADRVIFHAFNVQLDSAGGPGADRLAVVVDSADPSLSVTIIGGLGTPNTSVELCPITSLDASPAASTCAKPHELVDTSVPHGSTYAGFLVRQVGTTASGKTAVRIEAIAVRYTAKDRHARILVPTIAPPPGASVCKDDGCNPFFELSPFASGTFTAEASWQGVATARLAVATGLVAEHDLSKTGTPYHEIASKQASSDNAPGDITISGTLPTDAEAALEIQNGGARPLLSVQLSVSWP